MQIKAENFDKHFNCRSEFKQGFERERGSKLSQALLKNE